MLFRSQLGIKKLNTVFTPEELVQLKAIRNVAKFEQFQPVGAAVNTSNTASALFNLSSAAMKPLTSLMKEYQGRQALNISRALVNPPIPRIPTSQLVSPYSSVYSLLGGEEQQQ